MGIVGGNKMLGYFLNLEIEFYCVKKVNIVLKLWIF